MMIDPNHLTGWGEISPRFAQEVRDVLEDLSNVRETARRHEERREERIRAEEDDLWQRRRSA